MTSNGDVSLSRGEGDLANDDGSYSDDFDGDLEEADLTPAVAACPPGTSHHALSKTDDEAPSAPVATATLMGKFSIKFARKTRNRKELLKAPNSAVGRPRANSMELARQYGSMNVQDRLTQSLKRLKHEQKENSRLREALLQLQRTEKNVEVDNEKADLNRQLKECRSEIKTLKTELKRYESAQAEYQQTVSDYPERVRSITKELRLSKEKYNELMTQHREDERQIRSQHDKIFSLQKQLQSYTQHAKKGGTKTEFEREKEAWQGSEKEYRRIIGDLKSSLQKEQRRNRRMSSSMKNMKDQFEGEIIRLGNLLKEKDRKLSSTLGKFSITGNRDGTFSRNEAIRTSMTSRERDHDLDTLSQSSDIAHKLQASLEQIKSAFPSKSGCEPRADDNQLTDSDNYVDDYEEDFHE